VSTETTTSLLPAKIQLKPPPGEKGHWLYERDWSRDGSYTPQRPGDTPWRFFTRRLGQSYEIYPLFVLFGIWAVIFVYVIWWSFNKIEVWLDRSQELPPLHWARIRDNYWKKPTLLFDPQHKTRERCWMMEQILDDMEVEAKKRREELKHVKAAPAHHH